MRLFNLSRISLGDDEKNPAVMVTQHCELLNSTELYTYEWLKFKNGKFCFVYFILIKKYQKAGYPVSFPF